MADDHRRLDRVGSDAPVLVVVHVRPADADGGDPDEHLTRGRLGDRPVLDGQVVRSMEDGAAVRHESDS
jgi:hypothetical protein